MTYQLFKPIFPDKNAILSEIEECLDNGWTGIGYKTLEFEEEFRKFIDVPYAHFLNSATSGLHLALEIVKQQRGIISQTEKTFVATTPLTFIATNHVIAHAGKEPWFIDVDDSLCMDPWILENYLRMHERETLAVIYVGMGGNTGQLLRIADVCHNYAIPLIFDASHCVGTYYHNHHVGAEADFTVFSFQAVKNLPTADSGMLVCKWKKDDELARKLSWLGISKDTYTRQTSGGNWRYDVEYVGWKYHGNSIMAAMAKIGLRFVKIANELRRIQAGIYDQALDSRFQRIPISEQCLPSRHLYQIRFHDRDALIEYAADKDLQLGVHYIPSTEYRMYIGQRQFVPNATRFGQELVSLPIGPHILVPDINKIAGILNEF